MVVKLIKRYSNYKNVLVCTKCSWMQATPPHPRICPCCGATTALRIGRICTTFQLGFFMAKVIRRDFEPKKFSVTVPAPQV